MRAAISHPGFDFSVPSEVRARLLAGRAEHLLLETLLAHCSAPGWLKARGSTSGRGRVIRVASRRYAAVVLTSQRDNHGRGRNKGGRRQRPR